MVAPRQPPKYTRSSPPSSSPPPPSNSTAPIQPMGRIVSLTKREGTTTATNNKNTFPYSSSAPPPARSGVVRTNPTASGGRQPLRRVLSPSPGLDAPAPTLEGSSLAPSAGETPSRPGFALRRDGLGVPPQQQPQGLGRRRRRPIMAAEGLTTTANTAASSGTQEMPESKRLQVDRGDKEEAATGGGVAAPKPAPQALATLVASVETSPAVVEEQRGGNAPAGGNGKASAPLRSTDPLPAMQQQQKDRSSYHSDLVTPQPEESDPQVSKAAVPVLAISDVGGKPVAVEDPMNVDPAAEDGNGSEYATDVDNDDRHNSEFAALIKKHAELIRRSTLWIGGALQSIREDIVKAAAGDAGRSTLGELVRMSVTDFFEPAVARTRDIDEAADTLAVEVERYRRRESKSANELLC